MCGFGFGLPGIWSRHFRGYKPREDVTERGRSKAGGLQYFFKHDYKHSRRRPLTPFSTTLSLRIASIVYDARKNAALSPPSLLLGRSKAVSAVLAVPRVWLVLCLSFFCLGVFVDGALGGLGDLLVRGGGHVPTQKRSATMRNACIGVCEKREGEEMGVAGGRAQASTGGMGTYRLNSIRAVSMVLFRCQLARHGRPLGSTMPLRGFTQGRLTWLTNWRVGGSSG